MTASTWTCSKKSSYHLPLSSFHPHLSPHLPSTNWLPLFKNLGLTQGPWQWETFLQAGISHIRSVSVHSKWKHSGTGFGPEEMQTSWKEEKKKKVGHSRGREKKSQWLYLWHHQFYRVTQVFHTLVSQAQERSNDILIPRMKSILQHRTTPDSPLNKIPEFYIQSLPGSLISRYNFCYSPKEYTWWSDWFDVASY